MKIAVVKETKEAEARVAMVPELVDRVTGLGYDVRVEPGAGSQAEHADDEYADAGAVVDTDALNDADLVLSVQPLTSPQPLAQVLGDVDLDGALAQPLPQRPGHGGRAYCPDGARALRPGSRPGGARAAPS